MLVVCVKVGDVYGSEYVNRLASMVARHSTSPHRFVCLTDDPEGLECEWDALETTLPGWWAKVELFNPSRFYRNERVMYFDLDTVICGNIDALFDYAGPLAMLRSFLPPSRYGSAIMGFDPAFCSHIWERFTPDVMGRLYGDQDWIAEQMDPSVATARWASVPQPDCWQDFLPLGTIGSYKVHDLRESSRGYAICCFHGEPKPHQVNGWVRDAWR